MCEWLAEWLAERLDSTEWMDGNQFRRIQRYFIIIINWRLAHEETKTCQTAKAPTEAHHATNKLRLVNKN